MPNHTVQIMDNKYLSNNYAPVQEEVTVQDLPVKGEIPTELNGRFLRNGPNPLDGGSDNYHWFTGDGMVHGLRLKNGKAEWYRNRYVGSKALSASRGIDDIPGPNWNDSALGPNTSVGGFAGKTWAFVEAGTYPTELNYYLETVARNNFEGTLPGAFSAHPKLDPLSGEMHAMVYAWDQWMDHIQYVVVGKDGMVKQTTDIKLPGMTMIHDMSLTQNYAVIYDQPVTVDFDMITAGYSFPFNWNPDYGNRVGLLKRNAPAENNIIWIDIPLGYAFHPMNAYEDATGCVVIDICNYKSMFKADLLGPFGHNLARLERWTLNPSTRTINVTVIDAGSNEFPRMRSSLNSKAYRFGYCARPSDDETQGWPTVKYDLVNGQSTEFDHGEFAAAGEPVFVGKPNRTQEDAGWLMTFVSDVRTGASKFVIIDAEDFSRGYVAEIDLPQRIPYGFHGNWVSDLAVPEPV